MRFFVVLIFALLVSPAAAEETKYIVFFGDSLTAGLGVSPDEAYPALIQPRLPAPYRVQNSGVSGDTTADGFSRLNWALRNQPSIFVLALGANDGLRGIDPAYSAKNLRQIVSAVRQRWPETKILLVGIDLPTNLGEEYRKRFRQIFPQLAEELKLPLIPFLLEGVAGDPGFNQADGIHPNAEGHRKIAETVWKALKEIL